MYTYTIVANNTREKLTQTQLSLQFCIAADADISLSYLAAPGSTEQVVLRGGTVASFNVNNTELYVKGALGDKVSIFNGVTSVGSLALPV